MDEKFYGLENYEELNNDDKISLFCEMLYNSNLSLIESDGSFEPRYPCIPDYIQCKCGKKIYYNVAPSYCGKYNDTDFYFEKDIIKNMDDCVLKIKDEFIEIKNLKDETEKKEMHDYYLTESIESLLYDFDFLDLFSKEI